MNAVLPDRWLNELRDTPSSDLRLLRGDGMYVWDEDDRRYLDLTSGGGGALLGHRHPGVRAAIIDQFERLATTDPDAEVDAREELLEALSFIAPAPLSHVAFSTSSAEAVRLALRVAAASTSRQTLVVMEGSDHGGALTGLPGGLNLARVPFDDLDALTATLDDTVVAVLVEPVQVDHGMRVSDGSYLREIAKRCRWVGALLVVDEARTALRAGSTLACADARPDIVCLGHGLAGGLPFGAAAMSPSLARAYSVHWQDADSATPLVCAAANACVRAALDPTLQMGAGLAAERMSSRLRGLRMQEIREVRGFGMLFAVETSLASTALRRRLEDQGILVLPGGPGTIRLMPSLILDRRDADMFAETLAAIILAGRRTRGRSSRAGQDGDDVELRGRVRPAIRRGLPGSRRVS